jgi:hypothetical protein
MAAVDKVEYIKKHGPLPQFNRKVKIDRKTGKMEVQEDLQVHVPVNNPPAK